ncbi:hypothetical protein Tco_0635331 [Tanacetum coccineum]
MDELESDNESIYRPLVSPFLDSDDESDDGEVLNELDEYRNAGNFYRDKIINSIDGDDLAFPCMTGFRKFVTFELACYEYYIRSRLTPSASWCGNLTRFTAMMDVAFFSISYLALLLILLASEAL